MIINELKKIDNIFFVLDTSVSMEGKRIAELNMAMAEIVTQLKGVQSKDKDCIVKISLLPLTIPSEQNADEPISIERFQWSNLEAGGTPKFGNVFNKLNLLLNRKILGGAEGAPHVPRIIYVLSGVTKNEDWDKEFIILQNNPWYRVACKKAIIIENENSVEALAKIVGTRESVMQVADVGKMGNALIHVVEKVTEKISFGIPINNDTVVQGDARFKEMPSYNLVDDIIW